MGTVVKSNSFLNAFQTATPLSRTSQKGFISQKSTTQIGTSQIDPSPRKKSGPTKLVDVGGPVLGMYVYMCMYIYIYSRIYSNIIYA
jgi:hypothetical protein